jgi:magnesium chelatase subunit D
MTSVGPAETRFDPDQPFQAALLAQPKDRLNHEGSGKTSKTRSDQNRGRYVRSEIPNGKVTDLALDATFRAAAPHQVARRQGLTKGKLIVRHSDLRSKVRERKVGNTIIFILDSSGSMGVQRRMSRVKAAVLSLLREAYRKRDKVAVVAFKGGGAEILLEPTSNVELAQEKLEMLPTGGRTPLAEGLFKGLGLMQREARKHPKARQLLVLVTDGRANGDGVHSTTDALCAAEAVRGAGKRALVMDTEEGLLRFGGAGVLADAMGAQCLPMASLHDEGLVETIRDILDSNTTGMR